MKLYNKVNELFTAVLSQSELLSANDQRYLQGKLQEPCWNFSQE